MISTGNSWAVLSASGSFAESLVTSPLSCFVATLESGATSVSDDRFGAISSSSSR